MSLMTLRLGDYDELEDNHSYIQWLFPNFYRSDFNISAYKLEEHEAIEFRNDIKVKRINKTFFYDNRLPKIL